MGADRWSFCPQCKVNKDAEISNTVKLLKKDSPREDYYFRLDEGLTITYNAHCKDCSMSFEFVRDVSILESKPQ